MHQASILMTAFVMIMGVAWIALYQSVRPGSRGREAPAIVATGVA